jgi:hypothetical protein
MTDRIHIEIEDSDPLQNEIQMQHQQKELSPELLSICIIYLIEINGICGFEF